MASGDIYHCNHCSFQVIAWDEGNRYVTDNNGKRHYFYHPGHNEHLRVEKIVGRTLTENEALDYCNQHGGNERDYVCLDCASSVRRDPKRDALICHKCQSTRLHSQRDLAGIVCPKCKQGRFDVEIGACIS